MSVKVTTKIERGGQLWIFFDTGAFGSTPLIGTVIKSVPKTALVEWESGIRNRLTWDWIFSNAFAYNGDF